MFGTGKLAKKMILTVALASVIGLNAFAANVSVGTVGASGLRLRENATTESKTLLTAPGGTKVLVLSKEGDWYKVNCGNQTGYMYAQYLSVSEDETADLGTGVATGSLVNVRSAPNTDGAVLYQLSSGTPAAIIGTQDGWYKIRYNSKDGFISPDYFAPAKEQLASRSGSSSSGSDASSGSAVELVEYAKNYLGVKYVYGGSTPKGFDCSGFTFYVFKHFGVSISRTASAQFNQGTAVSKDNLKPGDAVFFSQGSKSIGHVGIFVGGGCFIHASSPGDVVKISSLSESYYLKRYQGARRMIG